MVLLAQANETNWIHKSIFNGSVASRRAAWWIYVYTTGSYTQASYIYIMLLLLHHHVRVHAIYEYNITRGSLTARYCCWYTKRTCLKKKNPIHILLCLRVVEESNTPPPHTPLSRLDAAAHKLLWAANAT